MEIPEGGEKEKGTTRKNIGRNNDENFPNLMMDTKTQTKDPRTPGKINAPATPQKNLSVLIFKLQKIKNKGKS